MRPEYENIVFAGAVAGVVLVLFLMRNFIGRLWGKFTGVDAAWGRLEETLSEHKKDLERIRDVQTLNHTEMQTTLRSFEWRLDNFDERLSEVEQRNP